MSKEKLYQPSEEEIKKAEEMMTGEEEYESRHRENKYLVESGKYKRVFEYAAGESYLCPTCHKETIYCAHFGNAKDVRVSCGHDVLSSQDGWASFWFTKEDAKKMIEVGPRRYGWYQFCEGDDLDQIAKGKR